MKCSLYSIQFCRLFFCTLSFKTEGTFRRESVKYLNYASLYFRKRVMMQSKEISRLIQGVCSNNTPTSIHSSSHAQNYGYELLVW